MPNQSISIVIPAKNEAYGLKTLLPELKQICPEAELIIVNDGSSDDTAAIAAANGAKVITHPYSMGNGAAVKTGARNAQGKKLIYMDADGQHKPEDIPRLLDKYNEGYDMVVGARKASTHASIFRRFANDFYNKLASIMTGYPIQDLTSGFRVVNAEKFRRFLYLLPNGFSYPTTSTMAFFRSGFGVSYVPIHAKQRAGKSHIRIVKDGLRFFIIILRIGTLFSPMRLFLPISAMLFATGLSYYCFTYLTMNRLTNMSAILIISSVFTFLLGILSEQISSLHYRGVEEKEESSSEENN